MKGASRPSNTGGAASFKGASLPSDDRENPFLGVELVPVECEKYEERKSFKAHMAAISAYVTRCGGLSA